METVDTTVNTATNAVDILTFDLGTVQHARQAHAMLRGVAAEIQDTLRNQESSYRVVGVRVSDVTDVYSEKYSTTYEIGAKYASHVDGRATVSSLTRHTAMLVIAVHNGVDAPQLIHAACTYAVPNTAATDVLRDEILARIGASHVEQTR